MQQPQRRKFVTPPVKAACTACRASRTRCDGKPTCANCLNKNRQCVYVPSRRGGPRPHRRNAAPQQSSEAQPDVVSVPVPPETRQRADPPASLPLDLDQQTSTWATAPPAVPDVPAMINPGAGLTQLDDANDFFQDSDMIFDSIFSLPTPPSTSAVEFTNQTGTQTPSFPVVRSYMSDRDLLDAYYIFIHQYFPIFPPPASIASLFDQSVARSQKDLDDGNTNFIPSSPASLAIAAILALIPHDQDPNPSAEEAVLFRRRYSHFLAQCAVESVDIESEMPDSSIAPAQALSDGEIKIFRGPLHPAVPVELESTIAYALLSVYEYSQRGNLSRMRNRAGQGLITAMNLCLHIEKDEEDQFSEARRRVWWMTYICVCQGSIVSSTPLPLSVHDSSFTARYPSIQADMEAWPFFIKAQQVILAATKFVTEWKKAIEAADGREANLYGRLKELEFELEPLCAQADAFAQKMPNFNPIDEREEIVADSLKLMARIKLNSARIKIHRYSAFFDQAIFTKKHCDLNSKPNPLETQGRSPSDSSSGCACNGTLSFVTPIIANGLLNNSSTPPHSNSSPSPSIISGTFPMTSSNTTSQLPFNGHVSGKICLKAALNIVQTFEAMPYPFLVSNKQVSRTMPSMSCCAMQSSYALLMISQKTKVEHHERGLNDIFVQTLYVKIHRALQSIAVTLDNYAIAAEAIGGMRDQVREAINVQFGSSNSLFSVK